MPRDVNDVRTRGAAVAHVARVGESLVDGGSAVGADVVETVAAVGGGLMDGKERGV